MNAENVDFSIALRSSALVRVHKMLLSVMFVNYFCAVAHMLSINSK